MTNVAAPSTPLQHPGSRRVSQIYVEIPPSPYSRVRDTIKHNASVTSVSLKENTAPLQSPAMQRDISDKLNGASISVLKRKVSTLAAVVNSQKKPKLSAFDDSSRSTNTEKFAQSKPDTLLPIKNVYKEFPDGWFNCHHCHVKHEPKAGIQCTVRRGVDGGKYRRCRATYCKSCLKKRYGLNPEDILATGQSPRFKPAAHGNEVPFIFQCPRCQGICTCYRCRKGLVPKLKKSELPQAPKWRPLHIDLSLANAEARIQVREFVVRFKSLMQGIAESHLEELGKLVRMDRWIREGDADEAEEEWVSEGCIKAVVVGLLEVIAGDEQEGIRKIIRAAAKDIRRGSANLEKIWGILCSMRDSLSSSSAVAATSSSRGLQLTFPDPYAPPEHYITRTTRSQKTVAPVVHSGQMLPVFVALTNLAAQTDNVRENLDVAGKHLREWVKEERDAHKRENDRWALDRKTLQDAQNLTDDERAAKIKARQAVRDKIFRDLENARKIFLSDFSLRSGPLGRDANGRVYWALTPGVAERETALKILCSGGREFDLKGRKPNRIKSKGRTSEERKKMMEWPWFLAVWGRKPETGQNSQDAKQLKDAEDSDEDEIDDDDERWWGFYEPEEIKKLAAWIGIGDSTSGGHSPTTEPNNEQCGVSNSVSLGPMQEETNNLCQALKDYADALRWRINREEESNDVPDARKGGPGRSKLEPIPAANFYA